MRQRTSLKEDVPDMERSSSCQVSGAWSTGNKGTLWTRSFPLELVRQEIAARTDPAEIKTGFVADVILVAEGIFAASGVFVAEGAKLLHVAQQDTEVMRWPMA